jgi:hypothetical protein
MSEEEIKMYYEIARGIVQVIIESNKLWRILRGNRIIELTPGIIALSKADRLQAKSKKRYDLPHPDQDKLIERKGDHDVDFIFGFYDKKELLGYSVMYPINKDSVNYLMNGTYQGGQIPTSGIANSWESACGYYIAYLISFEHKHRLSIVIANQALITQKMMMTTQPNIHVFGKLSKNTFLLKDRHKMKELSSGVFYAEKNSYVRIGMKTSWTSDLQIKLFA